MMTILVLGRSVSKAIEILPGRVEALLTRNGFSTLIPGFELFSEPEIVTTNNRSMLTNIVQMKWNLEYSLAMPDVLDAEALNRIEDKYLGYSFRGKIAEAESNHFVRPVDLLKRRLYMWFI